MHVVHFISCFKYNVSGCSTTSNFCNYVIIIKVFTSQITYYLVLQINLEIKIPTDILANATNETMDTRLQFIGYKRSQLFVPATGFSRASLQLNQPVISATVKGRELRNLSHPVEIRLFNTTVIRVLTACYNVFVYERSVNIASLNPRKYSPG